MWSMPGAYTRFVTGMGNSFDLYERTVSMRSHKGIVTENIIKNWTT